MKPSENRIRNYEIVDIFPKKGESQPVIEIAREVGHALTRFEQEKRMSNIQDDQDK